MSYPYTVDFIFGHEIGDTFCPISFKTSGVQPDSGDDGEETSLIFSEYKRLKDLRNKPVSVQDGIYCKAKYDEKLKGYIPYSESMRDSGEGMWNPQVDFLGVDIFPIYWDYESESYIQAETKTLYYKQLASEDDTLETSGYNNWFTPDYYHVGYLYKWRPIESYEYGVEVDWDYIWEKEQEGDEEAVREYKQQVEAEAREAVENLYSPEEYYVNVYFGEYDLNAQVISKDIEQLSQSDLDDIGIYEDQPSYEYDQDTDMNVGLKIVSVLPHSNKGLLGLLIPYTYNEEIIRSKVLVLRELPLTQDIGSVWEYPLNTVELDEVTYQGTSYDRLYYDIDNNGEELTISDIDIYIQNGTEEEATVRKIDSFRTGYSKSGWQNRGDYAKFEYDYFYNYWLLIQDSSEITSLITVVKSNNPVYTDTLDSLLLSRNFKDTLPRLFYCKPLNPWLYYAPFQEYQETMKGLDTYKYRTVYNDDLHGYIFGSAKIRTTPQNITRLYSFNLYFGGAYNNNTEYGSYLKFIVYNVNRDTTHVSSIRNVYSSTEGITEESTFSFTESAETPYRFLFLDGDRDNNITNLLALHDTALSVEDLDNVEDLINLLNVVLGKSETISYTTPEKVVRVDYSLLTDEGDYFTTVPYYYNQTVIEYPSIALEKIGFFKNGSFVEINGVTQPDSSSSLVNIPKNSNPTLSITDRVYTVYRNLEP